MEESFEEEVSIIDILKLAWKKKWMFIILLIFSLILLIVYMLYMVKPEYTTTTKILIDSGATSISDFLPNIEVVEDTANDLNTNMTIVEKNITATFDSNKKVITVTISADDYQKSLDILDTYVEKLKPRLVNIYGITKYDTIVAPTTPVNTYNAKLKKNIIIDVIAIFMVYIMYIFVLYNRNGQEVENEIQRNGIQILGKLNEEELDYKQDGWLTTSEQQEGNFNRIMTKIELNTKLLRPKSLLIVPLYNANEAGYIAVNLAFEYANFGQKVLILNTNKLLDITTENAFNANTYNIAVSYIKIASTDSTILNNEDIMSRKAEFILHDLEKQYDKVIIIGNSIIKGASSIPWAHITKATILVEKANKFTARDVIQASKYISDVEGKTSGLIITQSEDK